MSFWQTVGSRYRLYLKIMVPVILLNIIVNYFSLGIGIVAGIFVGPVLMMTSNAILGKRVKAWAKGRLLPSPLKDGGSKTTTPVVVSQQDESIEQEELLEDMQLTDRQREGKEAIRQRTQEKAEAMKESSSETE